MERVFLGTGLIGGSLAAAAVERGDDVVVWNRTRSKAEAIDGARVADTPADAVRGRALVHVVMTADGAVDAVLEAIRPHLADGAVVVDHTTASVAGTRERAARLAEAGIAFLHAPVFMSPAAARAAVGSMIVAGPQAVYDRVAAALAPMTGTVWYVGEEPGAAAATKLCGNAMILATIGGLADVHTLAARNGLPPEHVVQLFRTFDVGKVIEGRGTRMAERDYDVSWTLEMARKDLGLMLDAIGDAPLAVLPGVGERIDNVITQGFGDRDLAVLVKDADG